MALSTFGRRAVGPKKGVKCGGLPSRHGRRLGRPTTLLPGFEEAYAPVPGHGEPMNVTVERMTEAYLAGVVGLEEYRRRRGELERREQALEAQERR